MNKAEYVHKVFDKIADDYDAANEKISMGQHIKWKKIAASRLTAHLPQHARVLDLCSGTGDMISLLLEEKPGIEVCGLDFSRNMLRLAKNRFKEKANVSFVQADAMELPFENTQFDGAIISFALRNTADYEKVLLEMARVVKPGAAVCCIDSFRPNNKLILPFYDLYFAKLMPILGGGKANIAEYRWLSESTKKFVNPEQLQALMLRCGLRTVKVDRFMFGSCVSVCTLKDKEG